MNDPGPWGTLSERIERLEKRLNQGDRAALQQNTEMNDRLSKLEVHTIAPIDDS